MKFTRYNKKGQKHTIVVAKSTVYAPDEVTGFRVSVRRDYDGLEALEWLDKGITIEELIKVIDELIN